MRSSGIPHPRDDRPTDAGRPEGSRNLKAIGVAGNHWADTHRGLTRIQVQTLQGAGHLSRALVSRVFIRRVSGRLARSRSSGDRPAEHNAAISIKLLSGVARTRNLARHPSKGESSQNNRHSIRPRSLGCLGPDAHQDVTESSPLSAV